MNPAVVSTGLGSAMDSKVNNYKSSLALQNAHPARFSHFKHPRSMLTMVQPLVRLLLKQNKVQHVEFENALSVCRKVTFEMWNRLTPILNLQLDVEDGLGEVRITTVSGLIAIICAELLDRQPTELVNLDVSQLLNGHTMSICELSRIAAYTDFQQAKDLVKHDPAAFTLALIGKECMTCMGIVDDVDDGTELAITDRDLGAVLNPSVPLEAPENACDRGMKVLWMPKDNHEGPIAYVRRYEEARRMLSNTSQNVFYHLSTLENEHLHYNYINEPVLSKIRIFGREIRVTPITMMVFVELCNMILKIHKADVSRNGHINCMPIKLLMPVHRLREYISSRPDIERMWGLRALDSVLYMIFTYRLPKYFIDDGGIVATGDKSIRAIWQLWTYNFWKLELDIYIMSIIRTFYQKTQDKVLLAKDVYDFVAEGFFHKYPELATLFVKYDEAFEYDICLGQYPYGKLSGAVETAISAIADTETENKVRRMFFL